MKEKTNFFMSWQDLIISPLIQFSILGISFYLAKVLHTLYHLEFFVNFLIFGMIEVILTLIFIRLLLIFFPLKPGKYSYDHNQKEIYIFNLVGYLCNTNLYFLFFNNCLSIRLDLSSYSVISKPIVANISFRINEFKFE